MTLTIDFAPQVEAWLSNQAELRGVPPAEVVKQLVDERVPDLPARRQPFDWPPTGRAVDYLRERIRAGAAADPAEVREAEAELEAMKQRMNAERDLAGAERIF